MSCDRICYDKQSPWWDHGDCSTCPGQDSGPDSMGRKACASCKGHHFTTHWPHGPVPEEANGPREKADPIKEACQKCPWKEPAITLAGASWRMQKLNQTFLDDEGEVEMEHLAGLAKWGEDEIRKLQAIDIAANKERGNDEPKA